MQTAEKDAVVEENERLTPEPSSGQPDEKVTLRPTATEMAIERLKPWYFKKGQSGNPGGKSREPRVRDVAKESQKRTKEALEGIAKIGRDPKAPYAVRLKAWNDLLAWGHGKQKAGARILPAPAVDTAALSEASKFMDEIAQANAEAESFHTGTTLDADGNIVASSSDLMPVYRGGKPQGTPEATREANAFKIGAIFGATHEAQRAEDEELDLEEQDLIEENPESEQ